MHSNNRSRRMRICLSAASAIALIAGLGAAPTPAAAQTDSAAAEQTISFNVPAGPLDAALRQFSDKTGFQMVYGTAIVQGLKTAGVSGRMTPQEALAHLLARTALTFHMPEPHTVIIEAVPVAIAGARTLGAVQVEGVQTDAFAPLNGFGAGAGSNGSSDPTATEGTGSFTTNGASVASKAPQSLKDTPQSVSVLTQERIQQQNLTDLTAAVSNLPGVTVTENSGVQSGYISRGFTIGTYQIDGGAPQSLSLGGFQSVDQNLAEFDNVQIIRGSDALFGGAGQPGGVVSLDRKRPLDHDQVNLDFDLGSWNNYLAQADVTGPTGFDGALRGRLVVEDQDRDFFYKVAHSDTDFIYGVLEGDLGPNTLVRVGGSFERQNNPGYNALGLPRYSDGGDLELPRSTCLCATWGYWNFKTSELFGALEHRFNNDWQLKINVTRTDRKSDDLEPYIEGQVNRGAPTGSGEGISAFNQPGLDDTKYAADANLAGSFSLFGHKQKFVFGIDYARETAFTDQGVSSLNVPIPNIYNFQPAVLDPEPALPQVQSNTNTLQQQYGGYATLNLQFTDTLHATGGVRVSAYSYNEAMAALSSNNQLVQDYLSTFQSKWVRTPYAAILYDMTKSVSLYASYADIYQSQAGDLDPTGRPLPPVTGVTYEAGAKGAFRGGKLNASIAYYYTDESNQAIFDFPALGQCAIGFFCFLSSGEIKSQGVDLEVSGELLPGWQVQADYTYNENAYGNAYEIEDKSGTYTQQQPKHQVKTWTAYTLPGIYHAWTVGGGLRLESARSVAGSVCSVAVDPTTGACAPETFVPFNFTQGFYAVADLHVGYKINNHWKAALNITNINDARYYTTVGSSSNSNFYGEPRAFMLSVHATF
jgi:outer-membrane receptor for ferric coprogen and ferric-rhodotorulic acid